MLNCLCSKVPVSGVQRAVCAYLGVQKGKESSSRTSAETKATACRITCLTSCPGKRKATQVIGMTPGFLALRRMC
jgi:hypothetical protein